MIERISTKIGTNTRMIIGKMTKICHDMPTELAIATMILADMMTNSL